MIFNSVSDEVVDEPFGFITIGPRESSPGGAEGVGADEDCALVFGSIDNGVEHGLSVHSGAVEGDDEWGFFGGVFGIERFGCVAFGFALELIHAGFGVGADGFEDGFEIVSGAYGIEIGVVFEGADAGVVIVGAFLEMDDCLIGLIELGQEGAGEEVPGGGFGVALANSFGGFEGELEFLGGVHFVVAVYELLVGLGDRVEAENRK